MIGQQGTSTESCWGCVVEKVVGKRWEGAPETVPRTVGPAEPAVLGERHVNTRTMRPPIARITAQRCLIVTDTFVASLTQRGGGAGIRADIAA